MTLGLLKLPPAILLLLLVVNKTMCEKFMYNDNNYFLINNKSANWSEIQILSQVFTESILTFSYVMFLIRG